MKIRFLQFFHKRMVKKVKEWKVFEDTCKPFILQNLNKKGLFLNFLWKFVYFQFAWKIYKSLIWKFSFWIFSPQKNDKKTSNNRKYVKNTLSVAIYRIWTKKGFFLEIFVLANLVENLSPSIENSQFFHKKMVKKVKEWKVFKNTCKRFILQNLNKKGLFLIFWEFVYLQFA